MVRINHIFIIEVCGRRFIGDVDRVIERNGPDWESFKFGVAGFDSPLVFMVKL